MKTLLFALVIGPWTASAFEVVAHRGVHQNYRREGLTNETCTATRTSFPTHRYLENTLASIERAFELGATVVEVDVKATREESGPSRLVAFHDWTLECRTNASCENGCRCSARGDCITHEQSVDYLKSLDIGFGYTYDGGKTFPFRGQPAGRIPLFEDILKLLEKHPGRKILVDLKDDFDKTHQAFLDAIRKAPAEVRARVMMDRREAFTEKYVQLGVPDAIYQSGKPLYRCLGKYLLVGFLGFFPQDCRRLKFFIPLHETLERLSPHLAGIRVTDLIWGWPEKFIARAHENDAQVYISGVETEDDLKAVKGLAIDGLMTNRIEVIGPLLTQ